MFKIGDFSKLGQVSVRMLRHYDKLGLLTPSSIDRFTSYRYYTIDQLSRLHRIIALNDMGLTLQQISGLLDAEGELSAEQLRGMLVLRQSELEHELQAKRQQLTSVAARLHQIEYEHAPSPYEIVVKSVEPLSVASMRATVPHVEQMHHYCRVMFEQLYAELARLALDPVGPELTLYHNDEYTETNLDVETSVQIDPQIGSVAFAGPLILTALPPAPMVAALIHEAGYAEVGSGVLALLTWIGTHGFTVAGPLREIHLSGPAHVGGSLRDQAVIELQVPIIPTVSSR